MQIEKIIKNDVFPVYDVEIDQSKVDDIIEFQLNLINKYKESLKVKRMNPFKESHNDTTKFFLPIMFSHLTYDQLFSNYFEEAYIGKLDDESLDDTLVLRFNDDTTIGDIDHQYTIRFQEDNIVSLEIPEDLLDEYETFINGKYSELTDTSKENILNFWGEDEDSLLHGILYKTEKGRQKINELSGRTSLRKFKNTDDSKLELIDPPDILTRELMITGDDI